MFGSFRQRVALILAFGGILLLLFSSTSFAQMRGQGDLPGQERFRVSETLDDGVDSLAYPVDYTGIVNFELNVTGGTAADNVVLTISQDGNNQQWTAHSGERYWGTVELTSDPNTWTVSNNSGTTLSFTLIVYIRGEVPTIIRDGADNPIEIWEGNSVGNGDTSSIRLDFPESGIYSFVFGVGASEGYQFQLGTDYFQHAVNANQTVSAYVEAGIHRLRVVPDNTVATIDWNVAVSFTGNTQNTLPFTRSDGLLGGGVPFSESWFPMQLATAQSVNLEVVLSGGPTDQVVVELYKSATGVTPATTMTVYGGETAWIPSSVAAGVNRLHVVADAGNTAPLAITMRVHEVPEVDSSTPYTWDGSSRDANTHNSQILLDVATSGIYSFDFGVTSGRYQFALDDQHFQTSVEADGTVQAYVDAGQHTLTLRQDPNISLTNWDVVISDAAQASDTLPYQQNSGLIGGATNDFLEDWWPLALDSNTMVNIQVTVAGETADTLTLELYDANGLIETRNDIYGTESIWVTVDLTAGTNRLHFYGNDTGNPVSYQVDVMAVSDTPASWDGTALAAGGDSLVRFNAPSAGLYEMAFTYTEGAVLPQLLDVDGQVVEMVMSPVSAQTMAGTGGSIMAVADLTAGAYTIQVAHDTSLPQTVWEGSVTAHESLPGQQVFGSSSNLVDGQETLPLQVYDTGLVNFELAVDGGVADEELMLTVTQAGGSPQTWSARNGEDFWGTLELGSLENSWVVSNQSGMTLTYGLNVYLIGEVPVIYESSNLWDGTSIDVGDNSTIQLSFPTSGLYDFNFTVGDGSYQFLLDTAYLANTVQANETVRAHVEAGVHTLQVVQDSAEATSTWTVAVSSTGITNNSLPTTRNDGLLGGGASFDEAWIPISVADAQQVNLEVSVLGGADNQIMMELYDDGAGPTPLLTDVMVYGGETFWIPSSVAAGINRLHVTADAGNTSPVNVSITVHPVATSPYTWDGASRDTNTSNSTLLFNAPSSGLYDFAFTGNSGRYQFQLDDEHLQTSVEADGTIRAYVEAGQHLLTINHDTAQPLTNWAVDITETGTAMDTLPYQQNGGLVGGAANPFQSDWWPVALDSAAEVNVRVMVTGTETSSLALAIYDINGVVENRDHIYGGETIWVTADLSAGLNRLNLTGNTTGDPLNYQIDLFAVAETPTSWAGIANAAGDDSLVRFIAPADGLYELVFSYTEGAVLPTLLDATRNQRIPLSLLEGTGGSVMAVAELTAGTHTLQIEHDTNSPRTVWEGSVTAQEATPGQQVLGVTGTLVDGEESLPYQIYDTGMVNFELTVDGGVATEELTLTVTQVGSSPQTWNARNGEDFWGTVDLATLDNNWVVSNGSGMTLTYALNVYLVSDVPVVYEGSNLWDGVSVGAGDNSTIHLNFPTSGLYDFAFTVGDGRYQFMLDTTYLLNTVQADETIRSYVPAGVHVLKVLQDSTEATTSWTVGVTSIGSTDHNLPYSQSDGLLDGEFSEAWFPFSVSSASLANVEIEVLGGADDHVMFELYKSAGGPTPTVTGVTVYGGERLWLPASVAAGANRLHVVADAGNASSVAVDMTVHAVPSTPYTWAGDSRGINSRNSTILLDVPTSGLYDFDFTVNSGRYQFKLDDEHLQTSVEADGSVRAYVEAGQHTLTVRQDDAETITRWSVDIADSGIALDTLPYQQIGGMIGGTGNDFIQDWWPLALASAAEVNVRVMVTGTETSTLDLTLYDANGELETRQDIYGGETIWMTADLSAGLNRLEFMGNVGDDPLAYQVDVFAVEPVDTGWSGTALLAGGDSYVRFEAPVAGTYDIDFLFLEGSMLPILNPTNAAVESSDVLTGSFSIRVDLEPGSHTLRLLHGNASHNVWEGAVTLHSASGTPGDVTCDATSNSVDALFILQYAVGTREAADTCPLPAPPPQTLYEPGCDVTGDSACNTVDALFILQCTVGIPNAFCPAGNVPLSGTSSQMFAPIWLDQPSPYFSSIGEGW